MKPELNTFPWWDSSQAAAAGMVKIAFIIAQKETK